MKVIIYILLLFLAFTSCKKSTERKCIKSSGVESTIVLDNITANNIVLSDNISLILVPDSMNKVELIGGENLLSFINVFQDNKKLLISNENKCNFLRKEDKIEVVYHFSSLDSLFLNGFGDVENRDTIYDDLYIECEESFSTIDLVLNNNKTILIGQVGGIEATFAGFSDDLYMYNSGAGKLNASKLITKKAHGHSQGLGDLFLNATEQLIVELRSRGDFYIYTTPNTDINITKEGDGRVFINE